MNNLEFKTGNLYNIISEHDSILDFTRPSVVPLNKTKNVFIFLGTIQWDHNELGKMLEFYFIDKNTKVIFREEHFSRPYLKVLPI